ncbi:hypothetical protein M422DRAFT_48772 [Sphaerobolus stellatus SS14]|uniref:Uncharacterized protein n=1 Tax=Sphaerobolus stellatus (strain SS14) TaxID=990650 RepID=A0A0C9VDZ6_SPHS4|nr:hypothetical protein M422DRAFT_51398 [Sphaerobolus stellatus SS14]KIJ41312.1 hypothetical protein M422DRAFT_48772 [Sphaerobolus stellatus SS14]
MGGLDELPIPSGKAKNGCLLIYLRSNDMHGPRGFQGFGSVKGNFYVFHLASYRLSPIDVGALEKLARIKGVPQPTPTTKWRGVHVFPSCVIGGHSFPVQTIQAVPWDTDTDSTDEKIKKAVVFEGLIM